MGDKLRETRAPDGSHYSWMFRCPGCDDSHQVTSGWSWNGIREKPSFTPSVRVRYVGVDDDGIRVETCCHFFVTDGRIQYLADCTHHLAGQTVDLPDW